MKKMKQLREIQAYSNIDALDYKKKYWFHKWLKGTTALIEDEGGVLLKVKSSEFYFITPPNNPNS